MTRQTPSIPPDFNFDTYLGVDEFETCSVYREADEVEANRADVIRQIIEGEFNRAVRVLAFNISEGWARAATEDIATSIMHQARRKAGRVSPPAQEFVERVLKQDVPDCISAGY